MPPAPPKLVVVDTNCYARLYYSRLRPLLGSTFSGFKLVTITELAAESNFSSGLASRESWLTDDKLQEEISAAVLKLREPKKTAVAKEADNFRTLGNRLLSSHCTGQSIALRILSAPDSKAWATAVCIGGVLATDEWPLRFASERIDMDDDGNKLPLFSTLDIVHLIEQEKLLSRDERIWLMRAWRVAGESLHRDANSEYKRLFNEDPPDGQTDNVHKA